VSGLLLLLSLVSGWYMTGLIWTIQLAHYRLMGQVGEGRWVESERSHQMRMPALVGPAMLLEMVTALGLCFVAPAAVAAWVLWLNVGLVGVCWGLTAWVSMPLHRQLGEGFDVVAHRALVDTNWYRTAAWSARAVLMLWLVGQQLDIA